MRSLLKPQAPASYIEILGVAQAKQFFVGGVRRKDYLQGRNYMKALLKNLF